MVGTERLTSLESLWEQGRVLLGARGTTYVDISREEFEDWLDSLGMRWKLKSGTQGIYWVPLSGKVAIKVSSSLGRTNSSKGYARGSMQMRLISQITGQVLNKKLQGGSHFKRTKNWRKTLTTAIGRFKEAYVKSKSFYDAIAEIEDRATYQTDMLSKIEGVRNWQDQKALKDFHSKLTEGKVLTVRQKALLERLSGEAAESPQERPGGSEDLGPDPALLQRVRSLWVAAKRRNDRWTMGFARTLGEQLKIGNRWTARQTVVMNEKLDEYGI